MKKNKTLIGVLIAIGIVAFLAVAVFVYFIISDIKQEEKLQTEINDITTLMSKENIDYTEIDKRLNRTVTKGDCAKTEEAAKEYLKDVISEIKTITNILEDDQLTNILTASNYKADGPNFTKSKSYVASTKTSLIEATKKYIQSFNGNYTYLKLLKYFIWKDEIRDREVIQTSILADYLENKNTTVNNNWSSTLI